MKRDYCNWIQTHIEQSNSEWLAVTLRADSSISNFAGQRQSVWHSSSIGRVKTAHRWAITQLRRQFNRKMQYAAFLGGEQRLGVFPHIHAVLELSDASSDEVQTKLNHLWQHYLNKLFKTTIASSIHVEQLSSAKKYLAYCSRYEGQTFQMSDEKLLLDKSFYMRESKTVEIAT